MATMTKNAAAAMPKAEDENNDENDSSSAPSSPSNDSPKKPSRSNAKRGSLAYISSSPFFRNASDIAKRGFCPTCGCFLFWKHNDEDKMSFSLGMIDGPTSLRLQRHIFVADKGDYYDIADGLPQHDQ